MIRRLFYIALGICIALLAVSLLLPGEFSVERAIEIQKPPAQVYPLLANLQRWQRWWPWYEEDSKFQPKFEGPDAGPGATMTWDSLKFGAGKLVLQSADPASGVRYQMDVDQGHMHIDGAFQFTAPIVQTRVVWKVEGTVGSSLLDKTLGKYFVLFADRNLGPSMEQGLANLKELAEGRRQD